MMPEPGFQKPIPYLLEVARRKSKTSLFSTSASLVSDSAPTRAWIRWSQCTVVGTAVLARPACMNWRMAICPVTSWSATRSGRNAM